MMDKPTARGYLPIDGIAAYDNGVKALVFGAESDVVKSGRVSTVQAMGGTGGLKIGADFLKKLNPNAKVLISDPSWENHRAIFRTPVLKWTATPTTTPPTAASTSTACWPT
jgi:aromatic-amino-acid transaminase